jgi:hypothetical protein
MKWVTRRKARVDRIACPWLIRRFIDPQAASGFREISRDDFENMTLQLPVYDALYAYCRAACA